jgi:radical SAM-linked protein
VLLAKKGRAKYTSHLDMQRCMMRAVRRARIELWYTEGFNPHPYVTFALPLPLGVESDGEPVDMCKAVFKSGLKGEFLTGN